MRITPIDASEKYPLGRIFGSSSYEGGIKIEQYTPIGNHHYSCSSFYIPSKLKKVTVTGGCLFENAFANCSIIKEIIIGKDVSYIENGKVFSNYTVSGGIKISDENIKYKLINGNIYSIDEKTLIFYAIGKSESEFIVPSNVIHIAQYASI